MNLFIVDSLKKLVIIFFCNLQSEDFQFCMDEAARRNFGRRELEAAFTLAHLADEVVLFDTKVFENYTLLFFYASESGHIHPFIYCMDALIFKKSF